MKRSLSFVNLNSHGEEHFHIVSSVEVDIFQNQYKIKSEIILKCRVCGGSAHGYNFNQISCESCKAFCRRNALRCMLDLKCRFIGSCIIIVESRRQCTFCRSQKCFDVKMRKESIRTEEKQYSRKLKRISKQQTKMDKLQNISSFIQRKKIRSKILTNLSNQLIQYQQPIYSMNRNCSSGELTLDDWSLINNLTHTYDSWAFDGNRNDINNYPLVNSSLTEFLNNEEQIYRNLIEFFKQIPQFKSLDLEDQILLIKCNITHLVHIHHILKDNFKENAQIGLCMSKWINSDFHHQMSKTRHSLDIFISNPIVLKMTLVTLMFIINLSRLPYEQLSFELINQNLIIKNQNFFITLLWKYLNVIYNEKDAIKAIQLIVFSFLRYQLLMNEMENIIIKQNNQQQFHPLTKSVLRLT